MCGALCVMTPGTTVMLLWYVDSWGTLIKVRNMHAFKYFDSAVYCCTSISTDAVAFGSAHFGAGTGTIYLDGVSCTGSETNLIDCSRSPSITCSLGHSEDAGVRCQGTFYACDNTSSSLCNVHIFKHS